MVILLALLQFATALRPDMPILRSTYWWRIGSGTRPNIAERLASAAMGVVLLAAGIASVVVVTRA